jgi:polyketide synthase PksN
LRSQATPATWRNLIAAGWTGRPRSLRGLCGGEALPIDLLRGLLPLRLKELWNVYGPTETTVWSTAARLTQATEAVHIGKPIANTRVYVLDRFLNPLPPGIPGELYIAGDGVSPGYLDRPDLTAEVRTYIHIIMRVNKGRRHCKCSVSLMHEIHDYRTVHEYPRKGYPIFRE